MISFDEALATILSFAVPLSTETKPLSECLQFGLAEPLRALIDNPAFDNSEVDGYGVQKGAWGPLAVVGKSVAGAAASNAVESGQAVRILTGAPLPGGVSAVVMQEDVRLDGNSIYLDAPPVEGDHIRKQGSDYKAGDVLLNAGTLITPAVVTLLAANGLTSITASRTPRVSIVTNGDELIVAGGALSPSQIYESNGPGLAASVQQTGSEVSYQALVKDEPGDLAEAFTKALAVSDILIVSGGMSVGDRDHARSVLTQMGMREVFWRISMRPGKPVLFGGLGEKLIFGLPGNPVSTLVTFHLLVRPALRKLMGVSQEEPMLMARLGKRATKAAGRTDFQRGRLVSGGKEPIVNPLEGQDSYRAGGLAVANCLVRLPAEATEVQEREWVQVLLLP